MKSSRLLGMLPATPPVPPDPPPPPPLIYMKAERAGQSLLRVDWDVDKPRWRAENLDRWRLLRVKLALRRIMKSSNAANFSPQKIISSLSVYRQ